MNTRFIFSTCLGIGLPYGHVHRTADFFVKKYVSSYFINQFNFNDLEAIINSFQVLELPISKNNCQTIEKIIDLKNDKFFIKNFYENLKSNSQNFTTKINNQLVNICFNNKSIKLIEDKIIAYIEKKTERDFNKLIYGKIN